MVRMVVGSRHGPAGANVQEADLTLESESIHEEVQGAPQTIVGSFELFHDLYRLNTL